MVDRALGNLELFRQALKTRPMQRSERFEVSLTIPQIEGIDKTAGERDVVLFCEEIQIPGMVVENKEINLGPWKFYRNTNVGFLGQEINMTFLTDENWGLRSMFEAWIAACVDTTGKQVSYLDDISAEIQIKALSLGGADVPPGEVGGLVPVNKQWTLHECTPKVLNLVPLSMGTTSVVRTTLIISSAYWESTDVPTAPGVTVDLGKDSPFG